MAQSSTSTLQQQQTSLSSSLSSPYAPPSHHTLLTSSTTGSGATPTNNNNLNSLDTSIYSSFATDLGGTTLETNEPSQKITLLTRPSNTGGPSQSALSTSPLGSCFDDAILSRMMLSSAANSTDTSPLSNRQQQQRDYYYDTEDPSVNLHEFIMNSLQAPKNRVILLQLEDEFLKYVSDPKRTEPLKLPSWDSYHRMLAHRVAAYFGLEHNVDPQDKTRVVVLKGPSTRLPQGRFTDHIPSTVYEETEEPKLILKRIRGSSGSEKFDGLSSAVTNSNAAPGSSEIKSFEEREVEYEKARARIFSQSSTQLHQLQNDESSTSIPFDLFSSSPFASQSALRTPLHHRRTFSDTAFINKLFSQKENKPGPSSSGNSPSSTPAFFPPSPPSLSASSSSNVINQTNTVVEESQLVRPQKRVMVTNRPQPPSFMPLYSMGTTPPPPPPPQPTATALPIVYPHLIDPNWYYGNHPMVLYPVPAQGGATYPLPHIVPPAHYALHHPRALGGGARLPAGHVIPEHLGSHPGGVVYRPIPQPTLGGLQLKPEEFSSTNIPPPIWSPTPGPPPTLYQQQYSPTITQLTEQMDKELSINENAETNEHDRLVGGVMGGVLPPVGGQRQHMYLPAYSRGGGVYGYPIPHPAEPVVLSPTGLPPPHLHNDSRGTHPTFPPPPPGNLSIHHQISGGVESPTTIPPGMLQHQHHAIQSPIQILGHTLSTSIFSPPPSAGPSGLFMNQSNNPNNNNSKTPNSPGHSAVGSSTLRFTRFEPHKRPDPPPNDNNNSAPYKAAVMSDNNTSINIGGQPLPPRLAQRGGVTANTTTPTTGGGTRYQNQRHPSNRTVIKDSTTTNTPYQYGSSPTNNVQQQYPTVTRREPLLPTPSEMIKLDTGITAGVPVHIMEVLNPHSEDSPENQQLITKLKEHGAMEFKRGWMNRNTEVMLCIFDSSDTALQALKQCVLPAPSKLSIPLPTHAKYILQIL